MVRLHVHFNKLLSLEEYSDNVGEIGEMIKSIDEGFVTVKELIVSIYKIFKKYEFVSIYIPDEDAISFSAQPFKLFDDTKYGWLTKDIKESNLVTDTFNPDDIVLCLSDPIKKSEVIEKIVDKRTFIVTMYLKNGMVLMDTLPAIIPLSCSLEDIYKILVKKYCEILDNDKYILFDRTATRCDSIESIEFRIKYDDEGWEKED